MNHSIRRPHIAGPERCSFRERLRSMIAMAACALIALPVAAMVARGQSTVPRPVPERAVRGISADRSEDHVELLSSDRMMGRDTPSRELDSAARYIASALKSYGVEPVNGSYYHEFRLKREDLGSPTALSVNGRAFAVKNDFLPYEFSSSGKVSAGVVFVGFGISRPDSGYDDYANMDVRGRIVVAVTGAPAMLSPQPGSRTLTDLNPREKMMLAARRGAVGFLLLPSPARTSFVRPTGYPWRSIYPNQATGEIPVKVDLPSTRPAIPSTGIGAEAAGALFGFGIDSIGAIVRMMDSTGVPASMRLQATAELEVTIDKAIIPARNVVGMVRGSLLPDEYVVIGAHYDHIGYVNLPKDTPSDTRYRTDTIYNGADDNASGTAGLLMVAQAFGSLPQDQRPARSILFIAFSGEEKGLFGSRAYVAAPSVPIEQTVAMLNMDMIGRNNPDSVSLGGKSRSVDLIALAEQANKAEPMTLAYDLEHLFNRSDQASFAARKIPSLFFSTGMHDDYHQVADEMDKVDYDKLAHIARLCFRTAWLVAESPKRPTYDPGADTGFSFFE